MEHNVTSTPQRKHISSPVASGGGGVEFQYGVGAHYLAMALLGAAARGVSAGRTIEVRFQRLYEGEPLDDLIVISNQSSGNSKLCLQIKRDLSFGQRNATFLAVMQAAWDTFASPAFARGLDRLGFALGTYSQRIDKHYRTALDWARTSANAADFLKRIGTEGLSSGHQRLFVRLIRATIEDYLGEEMADETLWEFLKSLVIIHFDLEGHGSRDSAYAIELLRHMLLPAKASEAPRLFTRLVEYAAEANSTAGSLNAEALRQRLQEDNFTLQPALDCLDDLKRIEEHAHFILSNIRTDVGGLSLARLDINARARDLIKVADLVELIGPSGCGKSAILKTLAERWQSEGPAFVISGDRIRGPGWNPFAQDLGLQRPLRDLLLSMGGTSEPCIFIDGVDRIVDEGSRLALNDLLGEIARLSPEGETRTRWKIVLTAREDNLREIHTWLNWQSVGQPQAIRIPPLKPEEVQIVAEHCPRLRPLLMLRHLGPILSTPLLLRLLEDQRMVPDPKAPPPIATEIEVGQVWWQRFVGSGGGAGLARQQALLELGRRDAKRPGQPLSGDGIEAAVLKSLESDGLIAREEGRDVYRFGHDLLEDWVLWRVLDERRETLAEYLAEIGEVFGLLRPMQLLGASLLENDGAAKAWLKLLHRIERTEALALRWRQALLSAPLHSTRASELLEHLTPSLLADGGRLAGDLMVMLRTIEVNPDFNLLPVARKIATEPEDMLSVLLMDPIPRWRIWLPFMEWLSQQGHVLPPATRDEASRVMVTWQKRTPPNTRFRREIAKLALDWLSEMEVRLT